MESQKTAQVANLPVGVLVSSRAAGMAIQSSVRAATARRVTEAAVILIVLDFL
jgi:hypothetical protein